MLFEIAVLIALALAGCQAPTSEAVEPKVNLNANPLCPGSGAATWCLLFSDHSTATIELVTTKPNAYGLLKVGAYEFPIEGKVTDSAFTFQIVDRSDGAPRMPQATLSGQFGATATFATAKVAFPSVSETFSVFLPKAFPSDVTFDAAQSVAGEWESYPSSSTNHVSFELIQLGELILAVSALPTLTGTVISIWPGYRHNVDFSFPDHWFMSDAGSWINGRFSDDLTMATVSECSVDFFGGTCNEGIWRRK